MAWFYGRNIKYFEIWVSLRTFFSKKEKVLRSVGCSLTSLEIITPELNRCSYIGFWWLNYQKQKTGENCQFNPHVMSDITAADPSQSRRETHTPVWNLFQLFSTARSGLPSLDASAFLPEWDDWWTCWYHIEPIHEKGPLRGLKL